MGDSTLSRFWIHKNASTLLTSTQIYKKLCVKFYQEKKTIELTQSIKLPWILPFWPLIWSILSVLTTDKYWLVKLQNNRFRCSKSKEFVSHTGHDGDLLVTCVKQLYFLFFHKNWCHFLLFEFELILNQSFPCDGGIKNVMDGNYVWLHIFREILIDKRKVTYIWKLNFSAHKINFFLVIWLNWIEPVVSQNRFFIRSVSIFILLKFPMQLLLNKNPVESPSIEKLRGRLISFAMLSNRENWCHWLNRK